MKEQQERVPRGVCFRYPNLASGGVGVGGFADVSFWRKKMQKRLMINEPADGRKDSRAY